VNRSTLNAGMGEERTLNLDVGPRTLNTYARGRTLSLVGAHVTATGASTTASRILIESGDLLLVENGNGLEIE
jgi:hypothetical protein